MSDVKFPAWLKLGRRQLRVTRKTPPKFNVWERLVLGMDVEIEAGAYWRGDLMVWGTVWFGEDRATSAINPDYGTVKTWENNLAVCRRVPPDLIGVSEHGVLRWDPKAVTRRLAGLRYSHTAEVAYLDPDDQALYLAMALENGLSVRDLRAKIKFDKDGVGGDPLGDPVEFQTGSTVERMRALVNRIDRLLEKLPAGWTEERELLLVASASVRDALASAESRRVAAPIDGADLAWETTGQLPLDPPPALVA